MRHSTRKHPSRRKANEPHCIQNRSQNLPHSLRTSVFINVQIHHSSPSKEMRPRGHVRARNDRPDTFLGERRHGKSSSTRCAYSQHSPDGSRVDPSEDQVKIAGGWKRARARARAFMIYAAVCVF